MSKNRIPLLLACLFIAFICLFKVGAADFWWHVKAGELFLQHWWITEDPFAHTRVGQPYLATQSWLSDIILYLFFHIGGAGGIILLRIMIVLGITMLLLSIDKKKLYPNVLLACLLAIALLPSLKDRPQLFTYLLFAGSLTAVLKQKFYSLILLQFLWANLHGGASLVAFGLLGAAFLDDWYGNKKMDARYIYTGLGMSIAFLATPNFLHNLEYVQLLFTDNTSQFIKEWAPSQSSAYIRETWIFWLLAIGSLLYRSQRVLFSSVLLVLFGYLSISAGRHIPLFLILCIGIVIVQYREKQSATSFSISHTSVAIVLLLLFYLPFRGAITTLYGHGVGTYEPYDSAYDFVEEQNLQGNMFNTYNIGGYLLYRGHPERKVFVDGRNVDYGYDFLKATFDAAQSSETWNTIENTYNLSYAIIEHAFLEDDYPYIHILEERPDWHLVYLDEEATVYAKSTPAHQSVIDQYGYSILTPKNFLEMSVFDDVTQQQASALEQELLMQARSAPKGITSLLLLEKMYRASNLSGEADAMRKEIERRRSMYHDPSLFSTSQK